MNSSISIGSLLLQHPLYQATERCIDREITDTYKYLDFFSTWNLSILDYETIIRELFKVDENELKAFILEGDHRLEYNRLVCSQEILMENNSAKKFLRFILALPMLEYEIQRTRQSTSSGSPSCNMFDKSLSKFKYNGDCFSKISDDEILNTINTILASSTAEKLVNGLQGFAFHDYRLLSQRNDRELTYRLEFKEYLVEPICTLLVKTFALDAEVKYVIGSPGSVKYHVWSDILIVRDLDVFCAIEVKTFPILSNYDSESTGITADILSQHKIPDFMRQLIVQMVYYKTNMGVLTDAYNAILVEIDLDYFDKYRQKFVPSKGAKVIPLMYRVLNCLSSAPTLREGLMHFFFEAIVDDDALKLKQERMLAFKKYLRNTPKEYEEELLSVGYSSDPTESSFSSRPSTRDTNMSAHLASFVEEDIREEQQVDLDETEDVYMQKGDVYSSQLVKFDSYYMKKYLLRPMDDKQKLVAKIYDPIMANRVHDKYISSREEVMEQCLDNYNSERSCCQVLANDPEFNSCYVPHRRGYIKVTVDKYYLAQGRFNLFKFIDTVPMPRDEETYMKAKKQLEIIHRNGIVHGDIRDANILYTKDGKIFIIDFANSVLENESTDSTNKITDLSELKSIFRNDKNVFE
mgnify:CR=1 FL=1